MKKDKKIKLSGEYVIEGKRWFDRVNGNTYHSVAVYKNRTLIKYVPFQYGYGNAYIWTGLRIIAENEKLALNDFEISRINHTLDCKNPPLILCTDVSRKKDL